MKRVFGFTALLCLAVQPSWGLTPLQNRNGVRPQSRYQEYPVTGMVLDLKELKEILEREIMQRMDHRHLNHEVPELAGKIPTTENVAATIWNLLEPKITKGKLHRVRLYENPDLFVDCFGDGR